MEKLCDVISTRLALRLKVRPSGWVSSKFQKVPVHGAGVQFVNATL